MKICVIGDVHGRSKWKEINPLDYDLVIFIGDYFDSFDIDSSQQITNFEDILEFKETYSNVILLLGNHDCHYLWFGVETYSGFQSSSAFVIRQLLRGNMEHLNMCAEIDNYLFSHAGVSEKWLSLYSELLTDNLTVSESVNQLWTNKESCFYFYPHYVNDRYGGDPQQSPIWIRHKALLVGGSYKDKYMQVVGHTQQQKGPTQVGNILLVDAPDHYTIIDTKTGVIDYKLFKGK